MQVVFILAAVLNLASGRALKSESTPSYSIVEELEKFPLDEKNEAPSSSDDTPSNDASGVSTNDPAAIVTLPEPATRRLRRDDSCYLGWAMVVLPDGVKQLYAICKNGCTGSAAFMVGGISYPTLCS